MLWFSQRLGPSWCFPPTSSCPGPAWPSSHPRVPVSPSLSFPSPPHSCWEWRLHFSCHLHSQSIRTPQLSRLAELGGRRRRNGSSGGCRLRTAPILPQIASCSAVRSRPAREGSGNPRSSSPSLEGRVCVNGNQASRSPAQPFLLVPHPRTGWQVRGRAGARQVRGGPGMGGRKWAEGPVPGQLRSLSSFQSSHTPAHHALAELISALPGRRRGRSAG